MLRFTLVRLGQAILVLFVVATVVFLLSRASGNYAELVAPPDAPPETVQQIEKNLGLDKPLINQYVNYMKDLLHGDLGQSFAYRQPVRTSSPPPSRTPSNSGCAPSPSPPSSASPSAFARR